MWNEAGAAVQLSLAYQPWETAAFRLFALLALLAALVLMFRWRSGRLRQRAFELESVVALRTRELRARERAAGNAGRAVAGAGSRKIEIFRQRVARIRTPLTLTIGPLEDAQSIVAGADGALRRPIDMALRNARRLLRPVNQILDVAKLDAAEMKLKPRPLDLVPFTRGVAAAYRPCCGSARHRAHRRLARNVARRV